MTDEEFVKAFARLYEAVIQRRSDEDYVIDPEQRDKLLQIYDFFAEQAGGPDDVVGPLALSPREEHGGVTATFNVFHVCGDRIRRFCDLMRFTSAFGIDCCNNGVCISCTVPNVYMPKERLNEANEQKLAFYKKTLQ